MVIYQTLLDGTVMWDGLLNMCCFYWTMNKEITLAY